MKLSIITINKNNLRGLTKTVESVLAQTSCDYEHIVIDGDSTDGSKEFLENNSNIHNWISEPDTGIYNAMNKGIIHAHGEYILFLNSGDTFTNIHVLKKILPDLNGIDIISGYVIEENSNTKIIPPEEFTLRHYINKNIPHQAEFIKAVLFKEISMYSEDLLILSDYEFNIQCLLNNRSFKYINIPIALVEPGGISRTSEQILKKEQELIWSRNIPKTILDDYLFFFASNKKDYPQTNCINNHSLVQTTIKTIHRLFSRFK